MTWLLIRVLLSALVIRAVGAMTSTLVVADTVAALIAALIMTALAFIFSVPLNWLHTAIITAMFGSGPPTPGHSAALEYSMYVSLGLDFATTMVFFTIAALMTPKVTVRGFWGVFLAAVLLTAADFLAPYAAKAAGLDPFLMF